MVLRDEGVRNYVLLSNYRKLSQGPNEYSRTGVSPAICRVDVFAHSVRVPSRRVPNSDLGREALLSMSGKSCRRQSRVTLADSRGPIRSMALQHQLKVRVFCPGLLEDGYVRVGILPNREEILIRFFGRGHVAEDDVCSAQLQVPRAPMGSASTIPR